ncbi:hypothetical protein BSL78_08077 [Apostichopus japonicus]|uniref:TIR domain-containing protein n=1 Tax=Stichopus japonicus TaxID=307972 RepID=A0A2G8L436_STIJA|nr:hypothetical protein BSL78_08077 [Apostichopus japonicus]
MGNGSSSQKNKNKHQSKKSKSTSKSRSPRQSPRHTPGHSPEHYRRRKSAENQSGEGGQLVPQIGGTDRKASTGSTSATHQATHGLVLADSHRTNSMEPKDVMISYSHQDKDFMRKIKSALEDTGVTVWVDESDLSAGAEFLSKIGQAIIDAKLFLAILSPTSLASRYCKDELALAYVSSKPIFPCGLKPFDELSSGMDFGMRLQLAPLQWIMFTDDRTFDDAFSELIGSLKYKLSQLNQPTVQKGVSRQSTLRTRINAHHRQVSITEENQDYWERQFGDRNEVPWNEFRESFQKFVNEEFKDLDLPQEWILSILAQEVDEEGTQVVDRKTFLEFVTIDGEKVDFKVRVQEQALETYTMHKVFNMESTVRLDAIENLSKFKSSSVIEALLDLCVDTEANVRAVAAISLARSVDDQNNKRVIKVLMNLLSDRDRLVRQSGCLALGHMKATAAVDKLVNIWRNDFISTVREAAEIALKNIGGEEAKKAVHITNVLAAEIKSLGQGDA